MAAARLEVSRIGQGWLLLSLLLLVIGWLRGINVVLLLAYFLLVLWMINFFLAGRGLSRLRARRRLEEPIFARKPFALSMEIVNPWRRDRIGVQLTDQLSPDFFLVRLRGGETVPWTREWTVPRRGRFRWQALCAVNGAPFGLVRRSVGLVPAEDVIVLPELGRLHRGRLRRFLTCEASLADRMPPRPRPAAAHAEFHGLRPFRNGDSFRSIHWRTSARRGEWMVREFENAVTDNLILVFDPWQPDAGPLLEDAVSLAATICWEWCRQRGDRFALAIGGPKPVIWEGVTGPEHARRMLEELALLEGSSASEAGPLVETLANGNLPSGPLLLLSRRANDLAPLLSARLHRAVASLDAAALNEHDFYERPAPDAA